MGWTSPGFLLNSSNGVTEVYYDPDDLKIIDKRILEKLKNSQFLSGLLKQYRKALVPLKKVWRQNKPLSSIEDLLKLFDQGVAAWSGLAITYRIPILLTGKATKKQIKAALESRKEADRFFDDTDRIFSKTLKKLFPKIGDFSRFISVGELRAGRVPSIIELKERNKHFIFYKGKIFTKISLKDFAKTQGIKIETIAVAKHVKEIKGQVAMAGNAKGKVRLIMRKRDIPLLRRGEVLVTPMTTPDYVLAMRKAAAFVTDEGGITSHAAIVAREMNKPCLIGTKIATRALKDGDLVEVDANEGVVRIMKRS